MVNRFSLLMVCWFGFLNVPSVSAHQPVMDMAPRWKQGYGFQIRSESFRSDNLMRGGSEIENPFGLGKQVTTTWIEGIYTFRREVRLSVKIPYTDQSRRVLNGSKPIEQNGRGLGDVIVGLPLKRYTNNKASTNNVAVTPSIRLPTGSRSDDFPVSDGSVDFGLSFSASFEKAAVYQYYDLFFWKNGDGDHGIEQGNEIGFDANVGWHPYHNNFKNQGIFVMLDLSVRYEERGQNSAGVTGRKSISTGPVFVFYQGGMMFRMEYKYPVYEDVEHIQLDTGRQFNIGIGFVF